MYDDLIELEGGQEEFFVDPDPDKARDPERQGGARAGRPARRIRPVQSGDKPRDTRL